MDMKKIVILVLIMLLNMPLCNAKEATAASEFNAVSVAQPQDKPETDEEINSYFSDDNSQVTNTTFQGYLQYNQPTAQEPEQDSIYLEPVETQKVNFSKPKKIGAKSLLSDPKVPTFEPIGGKIQNASAHSAAEYSINPISTSYSYKTGRFKFGTMYDSSLSSASTNYTTGIFSKYEGKHFAISTAFAKDTNIQADSFNDKIFIAPEIKLTKNLSLLDVMQTDVNQINKDNKFVLRYTPHFKKYADEVQFELGAGQSFYQDNYVKSYINFATRFKL